MDQKEGKQSDGRPLIQGETVDSAGQTDHLNLEQSLRQRNKKILMGVGIGILSIGVILAIVLPFVVDNKAVPPGPEPPFEFYNPYVIDPQSVKTLPSRITGIMKVQQKYNSEEHS